MSADPIDNGQETDQFLLQVALRNAKAATVLPNKGSCYNCDDDIRQGLFCCPECRDDYEKREKARNR